MFGFKINRRAEQAASHAPVEAGLPSKVLHETGVGRKQQSKGGKMSRVKSAREKKAGKEDRAGKVRGETIDLAAFE